MVLNKVDFDKSCLIKQVARRLVALQQVLSITERLIWLHIRQEDIWDMEFLWKKKSTENLWTEVKWRPFMEKKLQNHLGIAISA